METRSYSLAYSLGGYTNQKNASQLGKFVDGGNGDDSSFGNGGSDTIHGNEGADTLYGNDGGDAYTFEKEHGKDAIDGGDDTDTIELEGWIKAGDVTLELVVETRKMKILSSRLLTDVVSSTSTTDQEQLPTEIDEFPQDEDHFLVRLNALETSDF